MTKPDDGGPAFPVPYLCSVYGMTLRDWFAGQALAGMSSKSLTASNEEIAQAAYWRADAMLAQRNKGE